MFQRHQCEQHEMTWYPDFVVCKNYARSFVPGNIAVVELFKTMRWSSNFAALVRGRWAATSHNKMRTWGYQNWSNILEKGWSCTYLISWMMASEVLACRKLFKITNIVIVKGLKQLMSPTFLTEFRGVWDLPKTWNGTIFQTNVNENHGNVDHRAIRKRSVYCILYFRKILFWFSNIMITY